MPTHFLGKFFVMINSQMKIDNSFYVYHFLFPFNHLHKFANIHFLNFIINLNIEIMNFPPFIQFNNHLTIQNFSHFPQTVPKIFNQVINWYHLHYKLSKIPFFQFIFNLNFEALTSNWFAPQINGLHKRSGANLLPPYSLIHQAT